jgi:hypothetical protein
MGKRRTGATLPDCIVELVRLEKLPPQFRAADVQRQLGNQFSINYINTALANYAEETGNYVQRWSDARFRRVARGLYEIVE